MRIAFGCLAALTLKKLWGHIAFGLSVYLWANPTMGGGGGEDPPWKITSGSRFP